MALVCETARLEEKVIEALAARPAARADEILAAVSKGRKSFSIQAVYQELRKLERHGIVVKKQKRYSLRLLWLVELQNFASRSYEAYLKSDAIFAEMPEEGGRKSWVLSDLRSLLNLWTEISFVIMKSLPAGKRVLFERVEHVWFHTANPVNEAHFVKAMKREKMHYVLVSAGKTYLDKSYNDVLNRLGATAAFGRSDFPAKPNQYLSVFGDFIIDVRLSEALNQHVRRFYQSVREQSDLTPQSILQFSNIRGRCVLKLTRSAVRAEKERRKFTAFFGRKFS